MTWEDRYARGDSLAAIAAAEGVSPSAIVHRARVRKLSRPAVTKLLRRRLERMLTDGLTITEMARRADVTRREIYDALIAHGLWELQDRDPRRKRVARAYERGASSYDLAAEHGVSRRTVLRWLRAEGIEPRSAGRQRG